MKVIFLDIDWVLIWIWNAMRKSRSEKRTWWIINDFDEKLVLNLKFILRTTWARIVISSSWRHDMERTRIAFLEAGLDWNLVIGKTGNGLWHWRGNEVLTRINEYHNKCLPWEHISSWVMIDDDDFDAKCIKRLWNFVHTPKIALTIDKAKEAVYILNK